MISAIPPLPQLLVSFTEPVTLLSPEGSVVGAAVGATVGATVGVAVGAAVGATVGATVGVAAVSYTHLDVYKRQIESLCIDRVNVSFDFKVLTMPVIHKHAVSYCCKITKCRYFL